MSTFMDMLTSSQCVDLKKCGDVVVSPSDNMVAIYCHFCRDIFAHLPEFLRHLQWSHYDVLNFTKEQNVYSLEELLSEEEYAQSTGNNNSSSSSGDSGIMEEDNPVGRGFKGFRNKAENKENTLKICELKSHAIARNSRKRMSSVKNRILKAIENDEPTKLLKKQPKTESLEVDNILKPIDNDEPTKLLVKPPKTNYTLPITEPLEVDNIQPLNFNTPFKLTKQPTSSNLSVRKSTLTSARIFTTSLLQHKDLNSKPKLSSTVQKVQANSVSSVVKKVAQFPKPATKRILSPFQIRQVEILPKTKLSDSVIKSIQTERPSLKRILEEIGNYHVQKQPKDQGFSVLKLSPTPNNEQELSKDNNNTKRFKLESENEDNSKITQTKENPVVKIKQILDNIKNPVNKNDNAKLVKLDSENIEITTDKSSKIALVKKNLAVKKMQTTSTKTNQTNTNSFATKDDKLESNNLVLQTTQPKENLLVIKKEPNKKNKKQKSTSPDIATLLKNVGLPAMQNARYEDKITSDELMKLRAKAAQFSKIYMKHDSIWNYRILNPSPKAEFLSRLISELTTEVNLTMGCNLTKGELKRIINLISVWHQKTVHLKVVKNGKILPTDYFNLFGFLPDSFVFFCEGCEETFTIEESYIKHLTSHEGVYHCQPCNKLFKYQGFYEKHMRNAHF
ncbi:protein teflon isoform X2 [Drosophila elegans]|uniref:protein teflon isoform X2 n=1 Tax=Drosophila elegans TaxID=30023 RepID=UPI001BC82E5D|nr:protein teflon isoform X2 [Drosophila elegans]